jgi:hypothetical protein
LICLIVFLVTGGYNVQVHALWKLKFPSHNKIYVADSSFQVTVGGHSV